MNWGELSGGVVIQAIVADAAFVDSLPGTWIELPYGVGVGWSWDGVDWTGPNGEAPPVEPGPALRYVLAGWEWVDRFTDAEWKWLKTQRAADTPAGRRVDRLLDAIRWTDSVDVSSTNMDPFYQWLLDNSIPGGQTRIDELRAGI